MSPKRGVAPIRRAQIVRATVRCLARDGYSRLTMKTVAREAGVSPGILHYYFADKRAILVAALQAVTDDLERRVAAAQSRGARDARARVRALIRACIETAVEDREVWIVLVEFWGEMVHDARLRAVNAELYARLRRAVGALVARGGREGSFRRLDPEAAGTVVLAILDGLSLQVSFDPSALGVEAATRLGIDAVERFLLDGRGQGSRPKRGGARDE